MNLMKLRPLFFEAFKSDNKVSDIADRYINIGYQQVYEAHHWELRKRSSSLTLIPNYTTGTCSVTKFDGTNSSNAKTVDFSGSTLTASMIGRYLKVADSSYWHKIIYLTGSTVYLDSEILDIDTGSGKTFEIWKRFYYLSSDVDVLLDFDLWQGARLNFEQDLVDRFSNLASTGTAKLYSPYGIDPYDDTEYTTGTVSGTIDTKVLIGVSTNWLSSGIEKGDIIEIDEINHYVKRVENDTRIVLFDSLKVEITAGTTYKSRKNNPVGFEFYNPTDKYVNISYDYLSRNIPLIHPSKDFIILPAKFVPAIISRSVYYRMRDVEDSRMTTMLQIYAAEIEGLKSFFRTIQPRYSQFNPKIPVNMPGRD